jgi:hypothetical protein
MYAGNLRLATISFASSFVYNADSIAGFSALLDEWDAT